MLGRRRKKPATPHGERVEEPGGTRPDASSALDSLDEPWSSSLRLALDELESADPLYRPTQFWQPGVRSLLDDMGRRGMETFKSWPSSAYFFYPRYSPTLSYAQLDQLLPHLREVAPSASEAWFHNNMIGANEANKDIDVVLAYLASGQLPLQIDRYGESELGTPPQRYRPFGPEGPAFGRPFINYLKIISAASPYLDPGFRSVMELGSGFGVLGEILGGMDREIQYVNVDIPPLSVVADYYLTGVGAGPILRNLDLADGATVVLESGGRSACLSPWHLPGIEGRADVFVNAFSFQEMEPAVVANYASQIARLGTQVVISLNSRRGKPLAETNEIGVREQVTSDSIAREFASHGYEVVARLGRPAAPPQAELLIMRAS